MHLVKTCNVTMPSSPVRTLPTLIASVLLATSTTAQLSVNSSLTPAQLVNGILVGQGVAVSNLTFNGGPPDTVNDQFAAYSTNISNIGMTDGVVLCTGRAVMVSGSNMNPGLTLPASAPIHVADPDLAMIVSQQRSVAVVEFDFIPTGDSLSFRFVFGSEEYPEYVCSMFNDVFGFFLSGPGINGPFTNNAINLGVLPGTQTPIAINTVNSGSAGMLSGGPTGCAASDPNWQANAIYYVDNANGATVELDGFTVPIRTGAAVRCGETYHIKFAIAHAGDGSLESAVLIEGGSFTSTSFVNVEAATPMNDAVLTEGCAPGSITVSIPPQQADATVQLAFGGAGIQGTDLEGLRSEVLLPAGTTSISFPLNAAGDDLVEGSEALWVVATWNTACGSIFKDSVLLTLRDYVPLEIFSPDIYLGCNTDLVRLEATATGGSGNVTFTWPDGTQGAYIMVPGLVTATYEVQATDECPQTATISVLVESGCSLNIPNVITPNGDGKNDAWVIGGLYGTKHSVTVFNRWGQVVFESTNYNNNWRAVGIPDGTYFYEVLSERTDEPATGTLTVLGNGHR